MPSDDYPAHNRLRPHQRGAVLATALTLLDLWQTVGSSRRCMQLERQPSSGYLPVRMFCDGNCGWPGSASFSALLDILRDQNARSQMWGQVDGPAVLLPRQRTKLASDAQHPGRTNLSQCSNRWSRNDAMVICNRFGGRRKSLYVRTAPKADVKSEHWHLPRSPHTTASLKIILPHSLSSRSSPGGAE